ncbi:hypothetical protein NDU88_004511 [Pleurodeles waltl]|uniref:Myb-like domain-containing protein n=1 Tax=Pleurodeles waltl TaxID=8319 RepID=A0AAV7QD86_PLEWA|nr:hypothetical protein NDU88_004511 [Pleurodeles waltl]
MEPLARICLRGGSKMAASCHPDPQIAEELEKLEDGVLLLYAKLYGRPEEEVSAHQKRGLWQAIAKEVRTLVVYNRQCTHCRKRWEDLRRWARKTGEAQLEKPSQ